MKNKIREATEARTKSVVAVMGNVPDVKAEGLSIQTQEN
jgi:hypothetical protein